MQFKVRVATGADAEGACTAVRRSITECCLEDHRGDGRILEAWLRNKTPENVAAWFTATDSYCVVAESGGVVIGAAALGAAGTITLCYLVPEARHLGIGKALLVALESEALRRGIVALELGSTRTAHAFYLHNGYVDAGETESSFGLKVRRMRKTVTHLRKA
jgi:GNAT superfamily N-acetyltransferase